MRANILKRSSLSGARLSKKRGVARVGPVNRIDSEILRLSTLWEKKMNLLSKARIAKNVVLENKLRRECGKLVVKVGMLKDMGRE